MTKKIIQILCVLLFFMLYGYFFGEEYWQYHEKAEKIQISESEIVEHNLGFSFDDVSHEVGGLSLHTLPNRDFLDELIESIDRAKKRVYVEVYIFTERDMRDALIRAHQRGVDVKILLENNPYQAPYLNDKHYELFLENDLDVRWSDPLNYSLNHMKLMIIDDVGYVSTGNFSYSLFTKNRDFMIGVRNRVLLEKLIELFTLDFEREIGSIVHSNIITSPDSSRAKMTYMLQNAEKSIDFYFPYMQDEAFQRQFFDTAEKGVHIRGIVSKDFYYEHSDIITEFSENNIELHYLSSPKNHAKAILVDKKYLYIGSINFSRYSFDENRELGLIIYDAELISQFLEVFESDF